MSGPRASGDLAAGSETQARLAVSDDPAADTTGGYTRHRRPARLHGPVDCKELKDQSLDHCTEASRVILR